MPYSCEGCLGQQPDPLADFQPTVTPGSTVYSPVPSPTMVWDSSLPGGTPTYLPDLVANVRPATAGVPWWAIVGVMALAVAGLSKSQGRRGWF